MVKKPETRKARDARHARVRKKISGTPECPRLSVFRSLQHIYAQLIDDVNGVTLAAASSVEKDFAEYGGNKTASRKVGENYEDICFPITAEGREALHSAVLEAYEQKLTQQEEQTNEEGKNGKKSGSKKSQKQSDAPKADENGEEMSEDQEEQTEAGPEMSM